MSSATSAKIIKEAIQSLPEHDQIRWKRAFNSELSGGAFHVFSHVNPQILYQDHAHQFPANDYQSTAFFQAQHYFSETGGIIPVRRLTTSLYQDQRIAGLQRALSEHLNQKHQALLKGAATSSIKFSKFTYDDNAGIKFDLHPQELNYSLKVRLNPEVEVNCNLQQAKMVKDGGGKATLIRNPHFDPHGKQVANSRGGLTS